MNRTIALTLVLSSLISPVVVGNPSDHFKPSEYATIVKAAKRNDCHGELFIILLAIRKAENGGPGREFGIMNPKADNLDKQAGWASATVVKNYQRWIKAGRKEDYIVFLGNRYCPVGAENDPNDLNKHWIKNVRHWTNKLKGK